jgi:hypothetical protein
VQAIGRGGSLNLLMLKLIKVLASASIEFNFKRSSLLLKRVKHILPNPKKVLYHLSCFEKCLEKRDRDCLSKWKNFSKKRKRNFWLKKETGHSFIKLFSLIFYKIVARVSSFVWHPGVVIIRRLTFRRHLWWLLTG